MDELLRESIVAKLTELRHGEKFIIEDNFQEYLQKLHDVRETFMRGCADIREANREYSAFEPAERENFRFKYIAYSGYVVKVLGYSANEYIEGIFSSILRKESLSEIIDIAREAEYPLILFMVYALHFRHCNIKPPYVFDYTVEPHEGEKIVKFDKDYNIVETGEYEYWCCAEDLAKFFKYR